MGVNLLLIIDTYQQTLQWPEFLSKEDRISLKKTCQSETTDRKITTEFCFRKPHEHTEVGCLLNDLKLCLGMGVGWEQKHGIQTPTFRIILN